MHCISCTALRFLPGAAARRLGFGFVKPIVLPGRNFKSLAPFVEVVAARLKPAATRSEPAGSGDEGDVYCSGTGHIPVMLTDVLRQFETASLNSFLDCTVGAGGHSSAILQAHPEIETLVAIDRDPSALELARASLNPFCLRNQLQLHLVHGNFKNMRKVLEQRDPDLFKRGVDGILMDLGMSSMQVDDPQRGFSYRHNGPLDMRMDPTDVTCPDAAAIVNDWSEREIGRILRNYGEELRWKFLAKRIADAQLNGGVKTTQELVKLIGGRVSSRGGGRNKHPATRTFQALRIVVNDELEALGAGLDAAIQSLAPGGRLLVISFHSLEDRIVKLKFHTYSKIFDGPCRVYSLITNRPLFATHDEAARNPRARSARLRVLQRLCRM